jgi:hypothetical protein
VNFQPITFSEPTDPHNVVANLKKPNRQGTSHFTGQPASMRLSDDPASKPTDAEKQFSPRISTRRGTTISRNAEENEKAPVSIRRSTEFALKITDVRCSPSEKHSELMISTVRRSAR